MSVFYQILEFSKFLDKSFQTTKTEYKISIRQRGQEFLDFLRFLGSSFFLDFSDLLGRLLRFLDIFEIFCEVSELSFIFFHFYIFAGINDIYARKFLIYARKKSINEQ